MTAKYLITSPTYVRVSATDVHPKYLGAQARTAFPEVIEIDADVPPSRTWAPLNRAAQEALEKLGVTAAIVEAPRERAAQPEPETNAEMAAVRSKIVGRPSDTDPLTGEARAPTPPRITTAGK